MLKIVSLANKYVTAFCFSIKWHFSSLTCIIDVEYIIIEHGINRLFLSHITEGSNLLTKFDLAEPWSNNPYEFNDSVFLIKEDAVSGERRFWI